MSSVHTNNGIDHNARQLGGDDTGRTGTSTGTAATTMTDSGASFSASSGGPPANGGLVGHVVVTGGVYGVIVSNSSTVLTIDFWHNATTPETVASTPSTGTYNVLPGGFPSYWIGLSVATRTPLAADAFLTNDGSTISEIFGTSQAGLSRQRGTYSHTNGQATFTLTKTFTCTVSDSPPSTVSTYGIFVHGVTAAPSTSTSGVMMFAGTVPSPPTLLTNDTLAVTETVTIV